MAIRVQNTNAINFGVFGSAATVTHTRLKIGATSTVLATKALAARRAVEANGQAEFGAGALDIVFAEGDANNAGLLAILDDYFDGSKTLTVELLTSTTAEVTASGYSSQAVSAWSLSQE